MEWVKDSDLYFCHDGNSFSIETGTIKSVRELREMYLEKIEKTYGKQKKEKAERYSNEKILDCFEDHFGVGLSPIDNREIGD